MQVFLTVLYKKIVKMHHFAPYHGRNLQSPPFIHTFTYGMTLQLPGPLEKVSNHIFNLCNLLVINSRFS